MSTTKTILVTGGTRGIGAAITKRLLEDGYDVLFSGTHKTSSHAHERAQFVELDFSRPETVEHALDIVCAVPGGLYGVVNNAGICQTADVGQRGFEEVLTRVFQVNVEGPARLVSRIIQSGCLQNGGRIVNISSQLGHVGRAGYSAYCASKFGLNALSEVWASELGSKGITVNSVSPGWIETEMTGTDLARLAEEAHMSPEAFRTQCTSKLSLKTFQSPQEVASIVAFLVSDQATGITGRDIRMAGPSA